MRPRAATKINVSVCSLFGICVSVSEIRPRPHMSRGSRTHSLTRPTLRRRRNAPRQVHTYHRSRRPSPHRRRSRSHTGSPQPPGRVGGERGSRRTTREHSKRGRKHTLHTVTGIVVPAGTSSPLTIRKGEGGWTGARGGSRRTLSCHSSLLRPKQCVRPHQHDSSCECRHCASRPGA